MLQHGDASQPLHHHLHIMYFLIIWSSYSTQLTIKRNELSLELIVQLSIHLTMVLLSQTDYSLESGLQSIFQESKGTSTTWWYFSGLQAVFQEIEEKYNTNFWFFVFSVVWSFKTCAKTSIKIKTQTKTFLPMSAKLLLSGEKTEMLSVKFENLEE